jgi:hypothetical protein
VDDVSRLEVVSKLCFSFTGFLFVVGIENPNGKKPVEHMTHELLLFVMKCSLTVKQDLNYYELNLFIGCSMVRKEV